MYVGIDTKARKDIDRPLQKRKHEDTNEKYVKTP